MLLSVDMLLSVEVMLSVEVLLSLEVLLSVKILLSVEVLLSGVSATTVPELVPEPDVALLSEMLPISDEYLGVPCCDTLAVWSSFARV